jgi:hypothetical protein
MNSSYKLIFTVNFPVSDAECNVELLLQVPCQTGVLASIDGRDPVGAQRIARHHPVVLVLLVSRSVLPRPVLKDFKEIKIHFKLISGFKTNYFEPNDIGMRVANEAALDGHVTLGRYFNVARLAECLLRERDRLRVLHS